MLYLWVKALHIIAVTAWMAGLLYLPRLYVYHSGAESGSVQTETFKVMERRLLVAIMMPAMIVTWALGLLLIFGFDMIPIISGWLHAKIGLVVLMTVMHGFMIKWRRDFAADKNQHSTKFYRFINEVPTILMIAIVILVTVKPF
jgi:putative membrane protein